MAQLDSKRHKISSRRYQQAPIFRPLPDGVSVNVNVKVEMDEIARLGPKRAAAFMNGIAGVLNAVNKIR